MSNISQVIPVDISVMESPSFQAVIGRVAAILLSNARKDTGQKPSLSQKEMALLSETSWEQVNKSLKYLHKEGAIRIDRHRIIIKEPSLRKIAGDCFS